MSVPDIIPGPTIEASSSEPPPALIPCETLPTECETLPNDAPIVESKEAVKGLISTTESAEAESVFQPLSTNWLKVERRSWQILIGIVGSVLGGGWLVLGFFIRQSFDAWQWLFLAMVGLVIALLVWAAYFFPRRSFQATSWRLHPHGFEIRRGIWWRHRIFIPKDRIQHTDVHQGPIQRAYGLASLVLNTGGTHEPSITLDGLDMPLAESLREQLSQRDTIQIPNAANAESVA
jgi:membrane protein YdbS with pleckstrin-like domain